MTALDSQLLAEARRLLASDDELLAGARALLEQDGAPDRYAPVPPGTRARLAPTLTGAGMPPFGVQGLVNGRAPDRFQQEQLDRENAARAATLTGELGSLDAESRRLGMVQDAQIETQAAALLRRDELSGLVDRTLTPLPGEPDAAFTARKMAELNRLAQREGVPTGALPDAFEPQYGGFEKAGRSLVRGGLGVADAFSGQALQYLGSAQQGLTEGITGILDPSAVDIARQLDTPAKRMIEAGGGVSSGFANQQEVFQPSQAVAAQGGLPDSLGQLGGFLLERGPEAIATMAPMVGAGLVGGHGAAMAAGGLLEGLSGFGEAQKAAAEAAANPNLSPVQRRELLARARDEALIERTTYGVIATLLEKLPADQLFAPATVGRIRRIVGTAAAEGGTESLQSASEQIIQNVVGQPTDTTLAQGIEQALGEGLLGLVAGGVVAGGVGGKGGAKRPESVVPDAGRSGGVAQPQAPERAGEAPAAAQQPAGAGSVQSDGGAGVQPEPVPADFTDIIEQAAASDLTADEIAQALPDYLTDAEQESIIAGVEARRAAQPPLIEPPATPSTGTAESAAPSPAPEPAPVAPEPQASASAATEPTAAPETPEGAGSLRDGTREAQTEPAPTPAVPNLTGPEYRGLDGYKRLKALASERGVVVPARASRQQIVDALSSKPEVVANPVGSGSEVGPSSGVSQTKQPSALEQALDRIEREASERRAARRQQVAELRKGVPRGTRPGFNTLIPDAVDLAIEALARAAKAGVQLTRSAISRIVQEHAQSVAEENPEVVTLAVKEARKIVQRSTRKGTLDPSRLAAEANRARKRATIATLREQVKRQSQASRRGIAEVRRANRKLAAQRLSEINKRLSADASEDVRDGIRKELVRILEGGGTRTNSKGKTVTFAVLPMNVRGKFLKAVANTRTTRGLARAINRARLELSKSHTRDSMAAIRRRTKPKRLKKLTDERRAELRKLRAQAESVYSDARQRLQKKPKEPAADYRDRVLARSLAAQAELTDIANRAAEIYAEQKNERTVYLEGKAAEVEALVQKATTTDGLSSRKDVKLFDAKGRPVSPKSAWVRIKLPFLNPETVAMMLDGDWSLSSAGNAFRQILVNGLRKAQDARKGGSQAITDKLEGLAKDAGFKSLGDALARISGTLGKASQETVDIEVGGAKKISLGMAMHLYAMDPETRSRFVEHGQQASFDIDGKKRADKFDITTDTFEAVENALTTEQKAFVNGVKAVIESQREALFTVHRNLKGWEPEPQIDYFPIRLNRAAEARTPEVWDKAAVDKWLENAGFLKERAGKSGASILVGDFLSIAIDHLQSANDIIHLAEPIRAAATVLLDNRVQAAVEQKFGRAAKLRVQDIILGASGLKDSFDSLSARVFNRIVGNASKALVSINPMSWGRQAGGLATLKVVMPARVYAAGVAGSTNTGLFKRMMKSPYFRDRYSEHVTARFSDATPEAAIVGVQGTRTILNAGLRAAKNLDLWNALATVPRLTDRIKIVNAFDRLPARVAWAGYEAEVERLHPDWSEKQKFEWVDERASLAMRRSQNTHELIDSSGLASFARAHPWAKMFLAFTSDANKQFNLLVQGWNRGEPGQAIAAIAANAAWGAAMKPAFQLGVGGLATLGYAMLGAEPPEGGEEERNRQLLEGAAWNFVRDVVGIVYGADRLVEFAHYKVGKARAAKNPLFDAPALSVPEDIALSVSQLWDGLETQFFTPLEDFARKQDEALSEPDRKAAAEKRRWDAAVSKYTRAIEGATIGSAMATGVPLPPLYYAVRREVKRAMNVPNSSQIADAIEAGDTAKAERLAARAVKAAGESSRDRGQAAERLEAGASKVVPDGLSKPEQERWKAKYRAVIVAGYRKSGKAQTTARD